MKQFINKIKYRWMCAPTWIKVLDVACWLTLIIVCAWAFI